MPFPFQGILINRFEQAWSSKDPMDLNCKAHDELAYFIFVHIPPFEFVKINLNAKPALDGFAGRWRQDAKSRRK